MTAQQGEHQPRLGTVIPPDPWLWTSPWLLLQGSQCQAVGGEPDIRAGRYAAAERRDRQHGCGGVGRTIRLLVWRLTWGTGLDQR